MPHNEKSRRWWVAAVILALPTLSRGQIFTWSSQGDALNNPWLASMVRSGFTPSDDDNMVDALRAHPQGKRCLFLWNQNHSIFNNVADGADVQDKIYWPAGIAQAKLDNAHVIAALSAAAIKPDVVILDNEEGPGSYTMSPAQMVDAANDPHYADLDWPALPLSCPADRYQFDEILCVLERDAIHQGVLSDFEQLAPNVLTSNAAERVCTPAEAIIAPDPNGNAYSMSTLSGNSQAPAASLTAAGFAPTRVPFSLIIYGTNMLRISVRHTPVLPWYATDSNGGGSTLAGTGYWEEFLRHGVLTCGVRGMLFDPEEDDTAAARYSTALFDMYKICNGVLPQTLLTTDTTDTNSKWFASARVDTDSTGAVTRIVARVSFAPGVTKAKVVLAGHTFNVTRPARQVGAWVRWNRLTSQSLY